MIPPFRIVGRLAILGGLLLVGPARLRSEALVLEEDDKPLPTVTLPPLPEAKSTPWGKEVEGLSCRLIVPAEATHGQPIRATVEIRNDSDRTRYLCNLFHPMYKEFCSLRVTGPDGKALPQRNSYGMDLAASLAKEGGYDPAAYFALAAGKVHRFEIADLRGMFASYTVKRNDRFPVDGFQKDGKYRLAYVYTSPKCAGRYVKAQTVGVRNGKPFTETTYAETSKEQLAGVFAGTMEAAPVTVAMHPMQPEDLTVHEWGVFTVFSDVKHANVNRKQEWASLPPGFYRQFPTCRLAWRPACWDKPIVYFYTKQPSLEIGLTIKFEEGAPVVWWPACASPTDSGGGSKALPGAVFNKLRWSGWLGELRPILHAHVSAKWEKVRDYQLPRHAWLQDARLPDAARFTVQGGDAEQRGHCELSPTRSETAGFVYYDGLVPAPDYLRCIGVSDNRVTIKNTANFPIAHLFLVDRRAERKNKDWAAAYYGEAIPAGGEATIALQTMKPVKEAPELIGLIGSARQALLGKGLYAAEADSILKIWRREFFDADGLTAFWLLPQTEYDRMLPLELTPAPASRPIRVGIAHHPRFEMGPLARERVAQLIRQLDSNRFAVRDAANRQLEELGPWAVPQIREALAKKPPLETTRRLEAVLQNADASEWLKQTAPAVKLPGK